MKRIFTVQDISCLGRCSLTVALPLLSAMGVEAAIVPTAVLSTHTMFKGFTCKDLDSEILPIAEHWKKENIRFDGIYTGYLASGEQISKVIKMINTFREEDTLVAVDPAMADNGKLYPAFNEDYPKEMAKLCAVADIVLPNITEAALLTGVPYKSEYDEVYVKDVCRKLCDIGSKTVILTGVDFGRGYGVVAYEGKEDKFTFCPHLKIPASYHGTGDIFSSVFVGAMMRGKTMEEAINVAADYTCECIRITYEDIGSDYYGVEFERVMPYLIKLMGD